MTGRLLVTGGGGFVGRHAAAAAAARGYEVHATTRGPAEQGGSGATWHSVDLLDADAAARLVRCLRPTHLLHTAWQTEHGRYWSSINNPRWAAATACLASEFAAAGGTRFVLVGSCAEYDWSHGVMVERLTPTRPHTLYGAAKLAAHEFVQTLARTDGFTAATGRIFFAYGPHENANRFVPYVSRALAAGEPALLSGGRQIRDFLHVADVAEALLVLLADTSTGAFNIGTGEPVRLAEIASQLGQVSGRSHLIRLGAVPDRADDGPVLVADTRRLRALGWAPSRSLGEGLADTYAWWCRHIAAPYYDG
jgi:nucleoside-diphosphate-sugar epimerase